MARTSAATETMMSESESLVLNLRFHPSLSDAGFGGFVPSASGDLYGFSGIG